MTGLRRHDLLFFSELADSSGLMSFNRIVVSSGCNGGLVASEDMITDFTKLQTPELAKKMATLEHDEITSIGLESLSYILGKKFQGIRGFSR